MVTLTGKNGPLLPPVADDPTRATFEAMQAAAVRPAEEGR